MAIQIRPVAVVEVGDEFLQSLAALHEQTFTRPRGIQYYRWLYQDCPEKTLLVVAEDGHQIVGAIGARRWRTASGLVCGQLMDMIVTPDIRGSGVFAEMVSQVLESMRSVDFWFAHANPAGRMALTRKAGFSTIGRISVLEAERAEFRELAGIPSDEDRREASLDRLVMSEEERSWRFDDHPEFSYTNLGTSRIGPLIVKEFLDDGALMLDLMTPFLGSELASIVARAGHEMTNWKKIYFWSAAHLTSYASALAAGFRERSQERYLVGKETSAAGHGLMDFEQWLVSAADTEYM